MSWDVGATSNFGSLTFPATGGSGGTVGDVVNTSTIYVSSAIYLDGRELPYVYSAQDTTGVVGNHLVVLPFSYRDTSYQVIVNYDIATYNAAVSPIIYGNVTSPSTFRIKSGNVVNYNVQYITSGFLYTGPPPPPPTAPTGTLGTPYITDEYPPAANQLTVFLDYGEVVSDTPVTYTMKYGLTASPSTIVDTTPFNTNVLLAQTPDNLFPSTLYYFQATASNGTAPDLESAVASFMTISGAPTGTLGAATIDELLYPPTATTITVFVDTSEVVSPIPVNYLVEWGYDQATFLGNFKLQPFATNILSAVCTLPEPSTEYYFRARGSNPSGQIIAAISGPFPTTA